MAGSSSISASREASADVVRMFAVSAAVTAVRRVTTCQRAAQLNRRACGPFVTRPDGSATGGHGCRHIAQHPGTPLQTLGVNQDAAL